MLSVKNLEVVYQDVILVLRGISFEIPKGKIVALLGSWTIRYSKWGYNKGKRHP